MAISKKLKIQREHKKAEAAGTRVPVKANGLPVKPPKAKVICTGCRKEMDKDNTFQLQSHAESKHPALAKEKCWPGIWD